MTTITLPRATVEQALEALEYGQHSLKQVSEYQWESRGQLAMDALRAALAQQAEPVEPVAWLRVIDEAMVTHHLGVADPADDYETAKRKMNNLLCTAQDIGTFFAKTEPVQEPVEPVAWEGWWLHHGQHNYRAKPLTSERVKELMKLAFEVGREAAPPQRKPLTDEEIAAEWRKASECAGKSEGAVTTSQFVEMFVRAIERAHGIGEGA